MTIGEAAGTICTVNALGRMSLVAVCLVVLGLPAGNLCGGLGEDMADCHAELSAHGMAGCEPELAAAPECCGASLAEVSTDSILKRPDERDLPLDGVRWAGAEPALADPHVLGIARAEPPPRPPRHRLFSAQLL